MPALCAGWRLDLPIGDDASVWVPSLAWLQLVLHEEAGMRSGHGFSRSPGTSCSATSIARALPTFDLARGRLLRSWSRARRTFVVTDKRALAASAAGSL